MILDGMARSGDGTSVADADRASIRAAAEQAEQAAQAAEANPSMPAEAKKQLREAADRAREEADRAMAMTKALDVPPANRALFEKYRAEILKYTMGGLELLPF
jgi:thioesterase domain-containing protein